MKQNLVVIVVTILMLINITGCSVIRFAETRREYGLKEANKLVAKDFQLGFNATAQDLRVTLEYQPYEISKPRITSTDVGVGLAALALLGKVIYDNWEHKHTFTFVDDTFDWYDLEPWEQGVIIGVPADILLYWCFSYPFDRSSKALERDQLKNYPYRIVLPDYGNLGRDYLTITGAEEIEIRNFLVDIGYPSFIQNVDTLKFRASAMWDGNTYKKDYTVQGITLPPPPPQRVEIELQWGETHLRPGEKAILKVTVKNTDETVLIGFTTITTSPEPHFDNWKLTFGDIAQGKSETRGLGFRIDPKTPAKDVPVSLRFQTANGFVHPEIHLTLHVTE